ncbi:FtsX-like permease family protein [Streptomyces albipurpureus]|uniref:ABC transporter permease n=1 Tax=Streptomyces albipurpureus TaxID=2897419 RepID=A0ABT0UJS3_9ACTN|nr:ABC transporter permease [Streptomyces sp. CWNU-1]MCM2388894.1 ABC transporter permease [Streptomyces sp. CWNU-1]
MKTWYHSWRAAIRIARRDAWRAKGRSSLVLAMIALPIVGVSAADVTLRSSELSTEQRIERTLGAADAQLSDSGMNGVPILQPPDGEGYTTVEEFENSGPPEGKTDIRKALPAGSTMLSDTEGNAKLRTTHGLLATEVRELKASDPIAKGIMALTQGRFPQKSDEVAATTHFLKESGHKVGAKLTARGFDREYRIVGAYELPSSLKTNQVNFLPGAFLAPYDKVAEKAGQRGGGASTTYLVDTKSSFTWNMVQQANTKGVVVKSRAVLLDPPPKSEVPIYERSGWGSFETSSAGQAAALAAAATVVGLAILEICLLAGPAFAVGARRSRRQLGLVGANGGARSHIRAIVLAGGLVIGVAAAVIGTVLGLLLTLALQSTLEGWMGQRFGSLDIRPLELLGIALLAVFTGVMAALVPAITSSRQSVLASLTGRRGVRKSSRVLPVIGLVAILLGGTIALYGSTKSDQIVLVGAGSGLAELGIIALTPALVGLFGRFGRFLPLSPRLALRDAVRNRGRTAPAVAAVLAAVAGTVAVATYAASDDAKFKAEYHAQLPHGAAYVQVHEGGGRDVPSVRATVAKHLPVAVQADVDRIVVGDTNCSLYSYGKGCGYYEVVVPPAHECPLWKADPANPESTPADKYTKAERRKLSQDWRCKDGGAGAPGENVMVGDGKLLTVLGINDPAAEKALSEGKIVSLDRRYVDSGKAGAGGKVGIRLISDTEAAEKAQQEGKKVPGEIKSFDAYQMPESTKGYGVSLIVAPATVKAAALKTIPLGAYYSTEKMPSSEQAQRLDGQLDKTGAEVNLHIERGYVSRNNIVLLALTIFAGLITIGAAGIATGLAQADAEADLKTLAAVGAPPRVRRTLSGFQCGVVAVMGVVLGSAAGILPAIGLRMAEERQQTKWYQDALDQGYDPGTAPYFPLVLPWETFLLLLIAVPLGAALLAALVTRSRGALARREAT